MRYRSKSLLASLVTGTLVFVLTYAAAWVAMRDYPMSRDGVLTRYMYQDMSRIRDALLKYDKQNGRFPDSLRDVAPYAEEFYLPRGDSEQLIDVWDSPYQYEKTNDSFTLYSFGRDGKPGGVGIYADIYSDRPLEPQVRPTLHQFLFETHGSRILFVTALLASLFGGAVFFAGSTVNTEGKQASVLGAIVACLVIAAAAVVIAVFLAMFHIAASQSGH